MASSVLVFVVLADAMVSHSDASYCLCKNGLGDAVLQKNIDYACATAADCSPILPNGACYNPNTVAYHCNYAVNSYYQRKNQFSGSCDFQGTAYVSLSPPTGLSNGCVYPG